MGLPIKFNDLPLPVRERFVQLTRAPGGDPRVLVVDKSIGTTWLNYVLGVGALIAMALRERRAVNFFVPRLDHSPIVWHVTACKCSALDNRRRP